MRAQAFLRYFWSLRREVIGALLYWSGLARLFEMISCPSGAIVLMYHSVADDDVARFIDPPNRLSPEMFERQMAFLSRYRRVVPMSQLAAELTAGETPPAGTVCLTFDDGYLDNLKVAAPILDAYRLPATLFLATGYVARGDAQWADQLHWFFQSRTMDRLCISEPVTGTFDLATVAGRRMAWDCVHTLLLRASHSDRVLLLADIEKQLQPFGKMPRLTIGWDELRELRSCYPSIEIGGHTRDHIDLSTHVGEIARLQIVGCAMDLMRELEVEPKYFSFPYGRWCLETRESVRASGWHLAVGDGASQRVGAATDRYVIPRVDAPRTMTGLRFKTSGAYPGVLSLLGFH